MLSETQRIKNMTCPEGTIDLVIDTDAYNEIDDQYAIAYAMAASEKLRLKALYAAPFTNDLSSGPEDGMEKSYHEILKLLSLAGREGAYPVFRGSARYLRDERTPVRSDAAEDLIRRAEGYSPEKPLYVAAIGAITNIASALILKPSIADRIVLVWLGGNAPFWPDNLEFNCMQDVAAARVVTASNVPLVLLPCHGTVSAFTTTGPELEYWLRGKSALCDYLVDHTVEAAERYAKGTPWSRCLWDVTSVGWLLNDDGRLMRDKLVPTPIPEYDHRYTFDETRPLCRMVYHVERDALFYDLVKHITRLGN